MPEALLYGEYNKLRCRRRRLNFGEAAKILLIRNANTITNKLVVNSMKTELDCNR